MAEGLCVRRPLRPLTGILSDIRKAGPFEMLDTFEISRILQAKGAHARFLRKLAAAGVKNRAQYGEIEPYGGGVRATQHNGSQGIHAVGHGHKAAQGREPVGRAGKIEQSTQQNLRNDKQQNELDDLERRSGQARHQKAERHPKRRLLEEVLPELSESLPLSAEDPTFRIAFEYASGGILALMAYRAETGFAYPVEAFLQCLTPEAPIALLAVLSEK